MADNFAERHVVLNASTDSVDFLAGSIESDVYNVSNFRDFFFILQKTTGATGTHDIKMHSVDNLTPDTTSGMAFKYRRSLLSDSNSAMNAWQQATSSGFITTAGDFQIYELWGRSVDLSTDDKFVKFSSTEIVNSPCGGNLTFLATNPRFAQSINNNILSS